MQCSSCGHINPSDANFCSSCGRPLNASDDTGTLTSVETPAEPTDEFVDHAIALAPSDQVALVVRGGPSSGTYFVLEKEVTKVGRHPDSDIFLDDITVSRRHAEFLVKKGDYFVVDAGSLNGTYVNKQRIEQAKLATGDEVQIGKYKLIFVAPSRESGSGG